MHFKTNANGRYRYRPYDASVLYTSPLWVLLLLLFQFYIIYGKNAILGVILDVIVIGGFILWRHSLPTYIIEKGMVCKIKGDKILFKIKKEDIQGIAIKKMRFYHYFLMFLQADSPMHEKYYTKMAIIYDTCTVDDEKKNQLSFLQVYQNKKQFQHVAVFSFKRCLKICKLLDIKPTIL